MKFLALALVLLAAPTPEAPPLPQPPEETVVQERVRVPDEHALLGRPYFVIATREAHAAFTSEAPLEAFVGVTRAVRGYAVVGGDGAVAAASFTMPVASLDTGVPLRDEHLRTRRWLHADEHPEIRLVVVESRAVETARTGEGFVTRTMELVCDMTVRGVTREVVVPATVTALDASERTRALTRGDLLGIRCSFPLRLGDFGVGEGDPVIRAGKLAEEIQIDVRLFLSSVQP